MQNFEYEIKINILKYVDSPMNLALTCRNWSVIVKDPYAKTEWFLVNYGTMEGPMHYSMLYDWDPLLSISQFVKH